MKTLIMYGALCRRRSTKTTTFSVRGRAGMAPGGTSSTTNCLSQPASTACVSPGPAANTTSRTVFVAHGCSGELSDQFDSNREAVPLADAFCLYWKRGDNSGTDASGARDVGNDDPRPTNLEPVVAAPQKLESTIRPTAAAGPGMARAKSPVR